MNIKYIKEKLLNTKYIIDSGFDEVGPFIKVYVKKEMIGKFHPPIDDRLDLSFIVFVRNYIDKYFIDHKINE